MPTYQYACTDPGCGNRFELVQSFTDPNASECPMCAGPVRKVFSPVGVVFKGSGFYRNDSRKDADKKRSDATEPSSKPEPSTNSDTPAAKPAAAAGDGAAAAPAAKSGSSSESSSNGSSKRTSGANPAAASA
jgi:putative FmdB family regulatory protein